MLNEQTLRELAAYQPGTPVLSVYLNTDPRQGNADAYRLRLRNLLKRATLHEDAEAVQAYFDREYDWSGRGVAVFSSQAAGFFRAYPLGVPVRDWLWEGPRPYVRPLAALWDAYGGYGVVLVDKQGARFFLFHLGMLEEQEGVLGEEVRHTKRGGGSQAPGRRGGTAGLTNYADEVAERNLREAAEAAVEFFTAHKVRRLLIGGSEENVATFRQFLPKAWQSLIVGTFPMDMRASHAEVLEKALALGEEAERRREEALARQIHTLAAKGGAAVTGLDETLGAIHEGRVHILLVEEGYRAEGYRCTNCGFLTTLNQAQCPFCQSAFEAIPDAVELAVRQVLEQGGEVEIVPHNLEEIGHIGALLRY